MASQNIPLDLWDPTLTIEDFADTRLQSEMVPYVNRRYTEEEIWKFYVENTDLHPEEFSTYRPLAKRIRAFDVPILAGIKATLGKLIDISLYLENILKQRLPTIEWSSLEVDEDVIMKYNWLHVITPAPIDEATSQPMVLEIFGRVTGQESNILVELIRGTYANTAIPGIGVPFLL